MAKHIKREALIDLIAKRNRNTCNGKLSCLQMKRMVESVPAADVAPVRHGRWVYGEDVDIQCSICGHDAYTEGDYRQVKTSYCPNCGAKMDEEDTE